YTRIYDEYTESRLGFRASIDRKLNKYWSASVGIRVENVGVHNVPLDAPLTFQEVEGNNFLVALQAGLTRDSRDSYLRPTEGSKLDLGFRQFGADFTFPQLSAEWNKYWTVWKRPDGSGRHVLALRSLVGWTDTNTPVYERFYAGGFRSLRGFRFR